MTSIEPTHRTATHVPPGGGQTVWLVGDTYTVKLPGEKTGGAFSLSEAILPAGGGPPPHIHNQEDETFVVLEGELLMEVDDRTLPTPAGTVVHVPKGVRHSYVNVGDTPVRMLFIYSPAGMEQMFSEIGQPAQPGVPAPPNSAEDVAKMAAVADKYHFEFVLPKSEQDGGAA